jgi:metal transporter CNNM
MEYLIATALVVLSGLFSGLTLGLLSLDTQSLRRRARRADRAAQVILPVRERGNQLLTTLLLGNVIVNTTLSIYLGSIASGLVAGVIATALIVVFGEIVPQAVISRHALWFGSRTIWFTRIVMVLLAPVAYPMSRLLDWMLGNELPRTYSTNELMDIISEHEQSPESSIDADEKRIIHGALQFSHRTVREVMTPAAQVVSYPLTTQLSDAFFNELNEHGFSRVPVTDASQSNCVVGVLYVKDLIVEDERISIAETTEAFETEYLTVRPSDLLDAVLGRMLTTRNHLAIVENRNGVFLGVISLEDIIEEIIQQEIEDEDDENSSSVR